MKSTSYILLGLVMVIGMSSAHAEDKKCINGYNEINLSHQKICVGDVYQSIEHNMRDITITDLVDTKETTKIYVKLNTGDQAGKIQILSASESLVNNPTINLEFEAPVSRNVCEQSDEQVFAEMNILSPFIRLFKEVNLETPFKITNCEATAKNGLLNLPLFKKEIIKMEVQLQNTLKLCKNMLIPIEVHFPAPIDYNDFMYGKNRIERVYKNFGITVRPGNITMLNSIDSQILEIKYCVPSN